MHSEYKSHLGLRSGQLGRAPLGPVLLQPVLSVCCSESNVRLGSGGGRDDQCSRFRDLPIASKSVLLQI